MQVTAKSVFSDATVLCETQTRDIDTSHLNQAQKHYLKGVSENRQWEFTAGRLCAVQAIRGLGGSETEIPVGERGEPIWPKGFVGSITHTQGYAAAAVALRSEVITVGIDAETNDPVSDRALRRIGTREELSWVESKRGLEFRNPGKLLFAAKEAVFKAWFPLEKKWLGFLDAQITFNEDDGSFDVEILKSKQLRRMSGMFFIDQDYLFTAIEILAGDLPNSYA